LLKERGSVWLLGDTKRPWESSLLKKRDALFNFVCLLILRFVEFLFEGSGVLSLWGHSSLELVDYESISENSEIWEVKSDRATCVMDIES